MRRDQDAMMVVRAELCERLATLQRMSCSRRPADFLDAVQQLHALADAYQLVSLVRLVEALERVPLGPESRRSVGLYLDRMYDAIACDRHDSRACEAMLASVSIRQAF